MQDNFLQIQCAINVMQLDSLFFTLFCCLFYWLKICQKKIIMRDNFVCKFRMFTKFDIQKVSPESVGQWQWKCILSILTVHPIDSVFCLSTRCRCRVVVYPHDTGQSESLLSHQIGKGSLSEGLFCLSTRCMQGSDSCLFLFTRCRAVTVVLVSPAITGK